MADTPNYEVPFRRRRDQKTNYKKRLNLLKSGKARAVVRLSNSHTRVHLATYNPDGDENTAQTLSKELEEYGWEHHTGNIPAAYLTGYLAGMKSDVDEAVLDTGLRRAKKGSRIYAALKGLKDAGVDIPAGEGIFPAEDRINGSHIEKMKDVEIVKDFETVKGNIEGEFE